MLAAGPQVWMKLWCYRVVVQDLLQKAQQFHPWQTRDCPAVPQSDPCLRGDCSLPAPSAWPQSTCLAGIGVTYRLAWPFCKKRGAILAKVDPGMQNIDLCPGGAVDGAGIQRKEKAMDHMAIWCGEKDAAELGNSSKPPITPENGKGVENRSYGRRFLCTWSNTMRVTIILHAGQAGASVWTLTLMDLRAGLL
ncbi:uncharacterized protein [Anser cygnoides]|uniref:uncharacterized protein isoform X2 n=1 Tax=Anser cygnoides TaxID=8845 RepID=UPI0034D37F2F